MKKVILTKGLPGSGKSTWTKELIVANPGKYKRVNKDDLRAMLDVNHHSKENEKFVLKVRDSIILQSLEAGKHVIVDDTNLASKHETHIRQLVKGIAEVVIQDFTEIPLETCIKNDLKRSNSVGESVIKKMYKQFLYTKEVYTPDENLPQAIIVDIDGTLAHMNGRGPFDWKKVGEDTVDSVVRDLVSKYSSTHRIIVMSGRDEVCRENTQDWLMDNNIPFEYLFMREANNYEKDSVVKRRLFDTHVRDKYNVEFVLDDRNQVVDTWRQMGLKCLQVEEGDF